MDDHDLVLKHLCFWFVKMGSPHENRTPSFSSVTTNAAALGCPASWGHCNEDDWRKPLCTATKLSRVCHQANQESLGQHCVNGLDKIRWVLGRNWGNWGRSWAPCFNETYSHKPMNLQNIGIVWDSLLGDGRTKKLEWNVHWDANIHKPFTPKTIPYFLP